MDTVWLQSVRTGLHESAMMGEFVLRIPVGEIELPA